MRAYFVGHLDQRIQLRQVATAAGVSPFHLALDVPPRDRNDAPPLPDPAPPGVGASAPTEPRASLTELALDLGFSSHSHLTAAFHREFGVPPSEARRRATAREEG